MKRHRGSGRSSVAAVAAALLLPGLSGVIEIEGLKEFAASYGGNSYRGISQWFFPFKNSNGWPVIMAFNAGEKPGVLTIEPNDEGWKGGPPLGARNRRW